MVKDIIRMHDSGIELNFGPLVVVEHGGIKFAMEDWRAEQLGFKVLEEEVPEFFTELKLIMQYAIAQISVYVFTKEDIRPLGKALSLVSTLGGCPNRVDVQYRARILMMWERGAVTKEAVTLDHYYDDLSEEEIEAARF